MPMPRAACWKSSGPTLIVNGDNFALLRRGRRVEANVGTPIYDPVKTIAHIPLAIYVTLTPGDGGVDGDRLKTLAGLRELIPPAEASLDALKLSAATLARQKRIVAASVAFLDDVPRSTSSRVPRCWRSPGAWLRWLWRTSPRPPARSWTPPTPGSRPGAAT